jgi:hypothetical protein
MNRNILTALLGFGLGMIAAFSVMAAVWFSLQSHSGLPYVYEFSQLPQTREAEQELFVRINKHCTGYMLRFYNLKGEELSEPGRSEEEVRWICIQWQNGTRVWWRLIASANLGILMRE